MRSTQAVVLDVIIYYYRFPKNEKQESWSTRQKEHTKTEWKTKTNKIT